MSEAIAVVVAMLAFAALFGSVAYLKFLFDALRDDQHYEMKRLRDLEHTVELNLTRIQGTLSDIERVSTKSADYPAQPTATIQDYVTVYKATRALQALLNNVDRLDTPSAQPLKKPTNPE